jgi:hopanoid biosynthesis associated glycosyl transferase protein HpnI
VLAQSCFVGCGTVLAALAMGYSITAWVAVRRRIRPTGGALPNGPPVTVLKPLCGEEPGLYECLRSFCEQDYPQFQIVFGVRNSRDSAVAVVFRLMREFPTKDLRIAIDGRLHGSSPKVSNLINMMPLASHDYFVIADSDVRVTRSYLASVVAPLLDPGVGIVTCGYRGWPRGGLWSLLGCLFINEWFMPSVCVAAMTGSRSFAFGATIAIRRHVLDGVGGFRSIANQLADDYRLGELTRRMGLRTVLSEVVVDTYVSERTTGARTKVAADDSRSPPRRPCRFFHYLWHAAGGHRQFARRRHFTRARHARDHCGGTDLVAHHRAQAGRAAVASADTSPEGHAYLRLVGLELRHAHRALAGPALSRDS